MTNVPLEIKKVCGYLVHGECETLLDEIYINSYLVGYECKQCNIRWNILREIEYDPMRKIGDSSEPTGWERDPDGVYTTIGKMLESGM